MPVQPVTRRHLVGQIRRRLDSGIAPVVGVRGPRQIGKTTAQFQIIQDLLDEGVDARRILRVQFDDLQSLGKLSEPILRISDWFERRITPKRFNTLAHSGEPVYLFFDEIQNLKRWDVQLKSLVDNASVKVVVTGSSALRIELGRDSLAGRINTIEAGVWVEQLSARLRRLCESTGRPEIRTSAPGGCPWTRTWGPSGLWKGASCPWSGARGSGAAGCRTTGARPWSAT